MVVNTPVDSTTYWAPASPHLMLVGSLLKKKKKKTEKKSYSHNKCSVLLFADEMLVPVGEIVIKLKFN